MKTIHIKRLNEMADSRNTPSQNALLRKLVDDADLETCEKVDALEGSWVEETYAEERGLECVEEYDADFYDFCKEEFLSSAASGEGLDGFRMDGNGMLYCERAIYVKKCNPELLLRKPLGVYWSYMEGNANAINSDDGDGNTVIYAHVNPADCDWAETIVSNIIDPEETEITLKGGAPVIVDRIDFEGGTVFTGPAGGKA